MSTLILLAYIVSAILFIFGLKMLSSEKTARRGNMISALGMLVAVIVTLFDQQILSYQWILVGVAVGGIIGAVGALTVRMTSMPEFVALFNGSGGLASLLVGFAEYYRATHVPAGSNGSDGGVIDVTEAYVLDPVTMVAIFLAVLIGGITFSGSLIAYGKLSERLPSKPLTFTGQQFVNFGLAGLAIAAGLGFVGYPLAGVFLIAAGVLALCLGVMGTIPIGGADMPVIISLLNSYSGLAACAAGFVIQNTVLIVSGSLVGASGLILTSIMCKAMNRSLTNVLFSGFGADGGMLQAGGHEGEVKPLTPEDAYYILEAAENVIFVPGYGMAVAQAQHVVQELGEILENHGAEVRYAIHPVAGRMPGHMNVLLAEADIPYEQLVEPEDINPGMEQVDVAIVIGANDVVNPDARTAESSPIYGMPIIDVDKARTVFVLKRSMRSGFAGVQNPLFFCTNTRMIFGDAKATVKALIAQFKDD